jgi:hypothetical protein
MVSCFGSPFSMTTQKLREGMSPTPLYTELLHGLDGRLLKVVKIDGAFSKLENWIMYANSLSSVSSSIKWAQ